MQKSSLCVQVCAHRDHLHSTLVGPNSAIASQTIEHALSGSFWQHIQPITHWQWQVRHIVNDAHSEAGLGRVLQYLHWDEVSTALLCGSSRPTFTQASKKIVVTATSEGILACHELKSWSAVRIFTPWLRFAARLPCLLEVLIDGQDHVGRELFGSQAIAATNAHNVWLGHGLQRCAHFQEKGLTLRALLLDPCWDQHKTLLTLSSSPWKKNCLCEKALTFLFN